MPQAIAGALVSGVSGATVAGALITQAAVAVAVYQINRIQARSAERAARAKQNASLKDRYQTVRSAESSRQTIYGRTRISGPLVYACTSGNKSQYMHMVVALASHQCDAVEQVWLDDKWIGPLDSDGYVMPGSDWYKGTLEHATETHLVPSNRQITLTKPVAATPSVGIYGGPNSSIGFQDITAQCTFSLGSRSLTVPTTVVVGASVIVQYQYSDGKPLVRARFKLGDINQSADAQLIADSGGQWTVSHAGRGICYMILTLEFDNDYFGAGIPNPSAIVRGKRVYDPRTGATAWSDNWALCLRDYLYDASSGMRSLPNTVVDADVIAAANISDESVPIKGAGTQKRYTLNGSYSWETPRRATLESLSLSAVGLCAPSGGTWKMRPGVYTSPVMDLTASDFVADTITVQAWRARADSYNAVRGLFADAAQGYVPTDFPSYRSPLYLIEDGNELLWADLRLDWVTDHERAQRIAKLRMNRARQSVTIAASTSMRAYPLEIGDRVTITLDEFGWDKKPFEVLERSFDPQGRMQFVFQEDAAAFYAWNFNEATDPDPAPNTNLPSPRRVSPLGVLATVSGPGIQRKLSDGTTIPQIRVSWAESIDASVRMGGRIIVEWMRGEETTFNTLRLRGEETAAYLDPVAANETMIIRACAENAIGVRSVWSYAAHIVAADAANNTAVVDADSFRGGLGVNLLENASMVAGIEPYTNVSGPGQTITYTINSAGAPRPFGAVMLAITHSQSGYQSSVMPSRFVPVSGGERLEVQARVATLNASARLFFAYYDAAGNWIATTVATGGVSTGSSSAFTQALGDFRHLWGFGVAPSNAASATIVFAAERSLPVVTSLASMAMPYLGRAGSAQNKPSPWVDGPPRGALAIADRATTPNGPTTFTGIMVSETLQIHGVHVFSIAEQGSVYIACNPKCGFAINTATPPFDPSFYTSGWIIGTTTLAFELVFLDGSNNVIGAPLATGAFKITLGSVGNQGIRSFSSFVGGTIWAAPVLSAGTYRVGVRAQAIPESQSPVWVGYCSFQIAASAFHR